MGAPAQAAHLVSENGCRDRVRMLYWEGLGDLAPESQPLKNEPIPLQMCFPNAIYTNNTVSTVKIPLGVIFMHIAWLLMTVHKTPHSPALTTETGAAFRSSDLALQVLFYLCPPYLPERWLRTF